MKNKTKKPTYEIIQLPKSFIRTFGSRIKAKSPYEKFHAWIAKQFGGLPKGKVVDVTASILNPADAKILKDLTVIWLKKYQRAVNPEDVGCLLNLQWGPSILKSVPKGVAHVSPLLFVEKEF